MEVFAGFVRGADNAECGAIVHRCQGAGIAVVQQGRALINQRGSPSPHAPIDGDIVIGDLLRRQEQRLAQAVHIVELAAFRDLQELLHRPS